MDHRVCNNLQKKNEKFGAFLKLHAIFQSYLALRLEKLGYLWCSAGKD